MSVPLNFVATFLGGPDNVNVFVAPQISIGLGGKYLLNADSSSFFATILYAKSGTLQTSDVPSNNNGDTRYFNQMS